MIFGTANKLNRIDVNGGQPEVVAEMQPLGGSWSANGTILFGAAGGIMKTPASRRQPTSRQSERCRTSARVSGVSARRPSFPLHARRAGRQAGIYLGDLDAPPETQSTTPLVSTDYSFAITQTSPDAQPTVLYLRDTTLVAQTFDMSALKLTGEPVTVVEQVASIAVMGSDSSPCRTPARWSIAWRRATIAS